MGFGLGKLGGGGGSGGGGGGGGYRGVFDPAATYSAGDTVTQNGHLYGFDEDHAPGTRPFPAPTLVGLSTVVGAGNVDITITKPAGMAVGDLMLVGLCHATNYASPATPTGWTLLRESNWNDAPASTYSNANANVRAKLFSKVVTQADLDNAIVFPHVGHMLSSPTLMRVYRGVDTALLAHAAARATAGINPGAAFDAPAVTSGGLNALKVFFGSVRAGGGNSSVGFQNGGNSLQSTAAGASGSAGIGAFDVTDTGAAISPFPQFILGNDGGYQANWISQGISLPGAAPPDIPVNKVTPISASASGPQMEFAGLASIGSGETSGLKVVPGLTTSSATLILTQAVQMFRPVLAERTISGKTLQMRIVIDWMTNSVAPGGAMTFGIHPAAIGTGTTSGYLLTVAAAVAGSTVAVTPAINSKGQLLGAWVDVTATDNYILGVNLAAALATNSKFAFSYRLETRYRDT